MADPKLTQLTDAFAVKVENLLADVASKGESPKIAEALRTIAQQREKVRLGFSKTMKSNHLPGADGLARAADVVDKTKGWNASKRFWLLVASSSMSRGIGWGGLFGLSAAQKVAVAKAIVTLRAAKWPQSHAAYQVRIGWDPAHVEQPNNWP